MEAKDSEILYQCQCDGHIVYSIRNEFYFKSRITVAQIMGTN
jgi:hypothetical protein